MRIKLWLLTAALGAAAVAIGGAAGASSKGKASGVRVLRTEGIVDFSAAGDRVAVAAERPGSAGNPRCEYIIVWNPRARRSVHWRTQRCPQEATSGGQGLLEVALDRNVVGWLGFDAGNDQELFLQARRVTGLKAKGKIRSVAYAENGNGAGEDPNGSYLGNLFGKGDLFGFNFWSFCEPYEGNDCQPVGVYDQALEMIDGTAHSATVASGTSSYPLVATDGTRFATQVGDTVNIFDASGTLLKTVQITPGAHHGVALEGDVLTVMTGGKLEAYSIQSGALTSSIQTPSSKAVLTDLQSGVAVYVAGKTVHVVRLSDGRDRKLAHAPRTPVGAQLEQAGLSYAYNKGPGLRHGRVVFVPWRTVQARLG